MFALETQFIVRDHWLWLDSTLQPHRILHAASIFSKTDLVGTAQLKGLVFGAVSGRGLVGGNVRPGRDKVQSDGTADALHARSQRTGIVNLSAGPAHDPKTIDEGLGGEGAELLEELVGDFSAGGRAGGHGAQGGLTGADAGDGADGRDSSAAESGGEHG